MATVIFYTAGTSLVIPSDYNNTANLWEGIAGGGGGSYGATGGGGEYRSVANQSYTAGATRSCVIGAGGVGATTNGAAGGNGGFTSLVADDNSTTILNAIGANGGGYGGSGGVNGAGGGTGTSGTGTGAHNNGGNGPSLNTGAGGGGNGGGGAGGPSGAGGNGGVETNSGGGGPGGGGGGSNGGAVGGSIAYVFGSNVNAPPGGNGVGGSGGGAGGISGVTGGAGGAGTAGTGGGGGGGGNSSTTANTGGAGGVGATHTIWTQTSNSATAGPGGGGGGSAGDGGSASAGVGGNGGLYGGGGGSTGNFSTGPVHGGSGAQGILVLTYTPLVTIVHVQGKSDSTTPTGTTGSITFAAPVGVGNGVVGGSTFDTSLGTRIVSVIDNKGNNYFVFNFVNDSGNNQAITMWCLGNITNGPTVITVTLSTTNGSYVSIADEYSGLAALADLRDGFTGNFQPSMATTPDQVTSGLITTTLNGDLIYGFVENSSGGAVPSPGTGFTQRETAPTFTAASEDLVQTTAGAVAATWTVAVSDREVSGVVALKAAGAPPAAPPLMGQVWC